MTNKEFWKELGKLTASLSTSGRVPALINQARNEHLALPIVFKEMNKKHEAEPVKLIAEGKRFVQCATSTTPPSILSSTRLQPGLEIGETSLDGLFEDLQDCGYDGIAFITPAGLVGFEWEDFR